MFGNMFGMELIFDPLFATFLAGIATTVLVYWYGKRNHDYWEIRGIPYVKPTPFVGNVLDTFKEPLFIVEERRYKEFGSLYGHFEKDKPLLSVADPTLLRDILVKDFQYFNRRREFKSGDKVFDKLLPVLTGEDWRRVRSIVTPTFSTGKLKRMVSIFRDCAKTVGQNFRKEAEQGLSINIKKLYGAFTMDVIASSAFSTKIDSHNDPDNEFLKTTRLLFSKRFTWRFVVWLLFPRIMQLFRISLFSDGPAHFFEAATRHIMKERKGTGQVRNDFLQLLMDTELEVADGQKLESQEKEDIASNYGENELSQEIHKYTTKKHLSMDELLAQCVVFFIAGYDTTTSTLSYASYLLALNPDIQDRLRSEVDAALKENNGELTYEAIQSMKYMDNVISETLRLYPIGVRIERLTESDYTLGDTGITLEKNTIVTIPVYAIHRDPKFYPDPERFDPNRFTPEETEKRNPYTYLPFGAGPRNCVGMRFALMEIKVCLSEVITNFHIKKSQKTKLPLDFYLDQEGILAAKEIILDMEIRKDSPFVK